MIRYRALSVLACLAVVLCACHPAASMDEDNWSRLVDVSFKDTPLGSALETLLQDSGISYTIDPGLNHVRVNAVLRRVSLGRALTEVTKAAGAQLQVDGDVVNISVGSGGTGPYLAPRAAPDPDARSMAYSPNYLTSGEAAALVARPGAIEAVALPGGKIVLRGSQRALEDAEALLKALDTENALPRLVNIRVSVVETGRHGADRPIVTEIDVGAVEGVPAVAEISSAVPMGPRPGGPPPQVPAPRAPGDLGVTRLAVRVVPTINSEGSVCLTGTVSFSWSIDSGDGRPEDLTAHEVSTARCAKPGEPITLGGFTRRIADSGGEVKLEITAAATISRERIRVPPRFPGEPYPGPRRPDQFEGPRPPAAVPPGAPGQPPPKPPVVNGPHQPAGPPADF